MNNIIDKINENQSNNTENTIRKLKENNLPVVIYGAGGYASQVIDYLENHSVIVSGCFVDDDFYVPNKYIRDIKIETFAHIKSKYTKFNIVLAFYNADKCKQYIDSNISTPIFTLYETYKHYELTYNDVLNDKEAYQKIYDNLQDELSKETLINYVNSKINEDVSYIHQVCEGNQYFNPITIDSKNVGNDVLIDCGAFDGDSILQFCTAVNNKYKKIYAFEPNIENLNKLKNNIKKYNLLNIEIINKGAYDCANTLVFKSDSSSSMICESGDTTIDLISIDSVVSDEDRVTFIKMDIEGSELKALEGAEKTIKRCMPKLAICAYHKKSDLFDFYNYLSKIHSLGKKYEFYLRHHSYSAYELVLYAIPREQDLL